MALDLSGSVPASATAVVLNLTGTDVTAATFVTAYPDGGARPLASNLNLVAGQTVSNLVTVAVGSEDVVDFYNHSGSVDLVADLAGYYTTVPAASFTSLVPTRVLDTRAGTGTPQAPVGTDSSIFVDLSGVVPASATAVVLNLTGVDVTADTYVTAYPDGAARPLASNLNLATGQIAPNLVTVAVGSGDVVDFYNHSGSVDLVADLAGYFTPDLSSGTNTVIPKPTTVTDTATDVTSVAGDPTGTQTTVLAAGAAVPAVGGYLALPAGSNSPGGLLGTVTAVGTNSDGSHTVTTTPATLDDAYSTYDVNVDTDLTPGDVTPMTGTNAPHANTGSTSGPFSFNLTNANFTCSGSGGGPTITLNADLSDIHVDFSLNITAPSIHLLVTAHPTFSLGIGFTGQVTCQLSGNGLLKATIPLAGTPPIDLILKPVFTLTASGQVSVNSSWSPSMVLGFDRAPGISQDFNSFGSNASVGITGSAGFDVFGGMGVELAMAGGVAGVTGDFGPDLTGQVDTTGCLTVTAALKADLSAQIDLWVKHWTIALASGIFASKQIYNSCSPGLRAWGANGDGQLGIGTTSALSAVPVQVNGPSGIIATAGSYALRSDGTVWSWGSNREGQLGNGTSGTSSSTPRRVPSLAGITRIASGAFAGYAVRSDGTVWAWGDNSEGQLGNGQHGTTSPVPIRISGLTNVIAVAGGSFTGYALRSDGTVWAWGQKGAGDLGNGVPCTSYTDPCVSRPVRVSGLTGVVSIAGSSEDGYAVKSDGTVWAWGNNTEGQLGDGNTTTPSAVPVRVPGLTGFRVIAAGDGNAYALRSDGTVWAWGALGGGTIGVGDPVPAQVSGLSSITAVAAGGFPGLGAGHDTEFGYALRSDGTVYAWGDNYDGELGIGTSCQASSTSCGSASAVQVSGLAHVATISAIGLAGGYALVTH